MKGLFFVSLPLSKKKLPLADERMKENQLVIIIVITP